MERYSFKKGFAQVKQKDVPKVKQKIMEALKLNFRSSWKARLDGSIEPKVSEAKKIEEIFAEYNITDVWGE